MFKFTKIVEVKDDVKCRCGESAEPGGYCPYQEDVNNMEAKDCLCDCCAECRHECAMDI